MWDGLWIDAHVATMLPGGAPYGAIRDAALAVQDGRIAWIGPAAELPGVPEGLALRVHRCAGAWITPGLIDCHTHLVFGGDRADEFEQRLLGATYEEISRAGGGIRSTVRATRAATEDELYDAACDRLRALMAEGVTTVEIKSGYGLDAATETRCLRVARRLGETLPVTVLATFLGLHAVPPEFEGRADAYVDEVIDLLPRLVSEGLVDAFDAFCEWIAFTPGQVRRAFEAARALGLPVKLHAEQLSDSGGAALAAEFGALSADHLEYLTESGVFAMAGAGTVAVLLPAAFYALRERQRPPVDLLRRHGVPIALATDCNPGSSPCTSPLLVMNMGCTLFGLTPEEALAGFTRNAGLALGLPGRGTLAVGAEADLALWRVRTPAELCYWMGRNPCAGAVRAGMPA